MFFTLYSKKKGESVIDGIVGNDLALMNGSWKLTFTMNPIAQYLIAQFNLQDEHKTYEPLEQRLDIEGKEVYLRQLDFYPVAGLLFITVDVIKNPVPVLAIGIAGLAIIGVLFTLLLNLSKVQKLFEMPATYMLLGIVGLFFLLPLLKK